MIKIGELLLSDTTEDTLFLGIINLLPEYDMCKIFDSAADEIKCLRRAYKLESELKVKIFTGISKFISSYINDANDEIAVENNCFFYNLKLNYATDNTDFYALTQNIFLTYENLRGFLLGLGGTCVGGINLFYVVKNYIKDISSDKVRELLEYCFEFDSSNIEKSRFIPLVQSRLELFEERYSHIEYRYHQYEHFQREYEQTKKQIKMLKIRPLLTPNDMEIGAKLVNPDTTDAEFTSLFKNIRTYDSNIFETKNSKTENSKTKDSNIRDNEIAVVERAFKLGLNFDHIEEFIYTYINSDDNVSLTDGCNFHINFTLKHDGCTGIPLLVLDNRDLNFENLSKLLMKIPKNPPKELDFHNIYLYIRDMTDHKMKKLLKYCFEFDHVDWAKSSVFTPLTSARLQIFLAEYEIIEKKNKLMEKINKLSVENISTIEKIIDLYTK